MSTILESDTTTRTTDAGEHDLFAHYAPKAEILRAMVDGIPCTALCGKKWLPTKDSSQYPVCPTCADIHACDRCMANWTPATPTCPAHTGPTL